MKRIWLAGILLLAGSARATGQPLALVATIPLANVEGRIDHLAFDPASQRLFVAALGNNTVEVLDVRTNTHVRTLPGFAEPQGIAVVTNSGRVAVANGQGEGLSLLESRDLLRGPVIRLGSDADNVRYDEKNGRLYVGYGSGALASIDPSAGTVTGRVTLPGHPESFQLEATGLRLFVNIPSTHQLIVIDRTTMKQVASWPVTAASANYPLALDEAGRRVFVGCRQPARLLVYDATSGKVNASVEVVGDADDLFFDAGRQRLYVTGGEGFTDVLDARPDGGYRRLDRIPTASGARTSLLVPALNRLFVAVPHRGTQAAAVLVFEVR